MESKKQNLAFGIGFVLLGIALWVSSGSWILGAAFLIIGASRLAVALTMDDKPQT